MIDSENPGGRPPEGDDHGEVIDAEGSEFHVAGELIQRNVTYRSAPYPPPDDLRQYEEILPGFTDRILSLTERESEHRIQEERLQSRATIELARRGQRYAAVIVLTLIGVGGAAILTGHSVEGFAAIVAAAVALVSAFVAPNIFSRVAGRPRRPSDSDQDQLPPGGDTAS